MTDNKKAFYYRPKTDQSKSPMLRWTFVTLGWLFFILGIIGILLPVMPTAPFILLAAGCWARSSRRFHFWLINHKYFGKFVRDWEENHAVPLYAKCLATVMMTASTIMLFYRLPADMMWMAWAVAAVCSGVAIYLFRLPNA
ncbi:YbaN family protein [Psychrobacter sp. APC 3281]|uniref:YbaN family protein n=1 Tax=Psychrobacter sp. APC 3281 TaxID=3035190 RepID=UPI0025B50BCB|nr:YbaN family protein [Psychrobacter sp. APC 3281]MDN3447994.1 YbaN family protein [Psychrobacter sp. APC 3281]